MARASNTVIALINFAFLVFSIVAIGAGLYIYSHDVSNCQKLTQNSLMIVGFVIFVMSLLGLVGSCCKANSLLVIYLIVMFFVIVGLLAFSIFAFLVASESGGEAVSGLGFRECRLEDFSKWLQTYYTNPASWNKIKSCLIDAQVCGSLSQNVNKGILEFYKMHLSPIQSGCCKPPTSCGFKFENATFWTWVPGLARDGDGDCRIWSNEETKLCYECGACKAGFAANFSKQYMILGACSLIIIASLILVYSIGCCARSNNKYDSYRRYSAYSRP